MKKVVLIPLTILALLCSCSDEKPKNMEKAVSENAQQNEVTVKQDSVIWYAEPNDNIAPGDFLYNWGHATIMCPEGYRLPSVEEFKNVSQEVKAQQGLAADSSEDKAWWTIQLASFESNGIDSIVPKATAVRFEKDSIIVFDEDVTQEHHIRCVKKSDESYPINPVPQKKAEISGTIEDVKFEPYYEASLSNMGCADCCCEEGNGAILKVTVSSADGSLNSFNVKELNSKFCGAIAFDKNGKPTDLQTEDCETIEPDKFKVLALFQPGLKVKQISCSTPIFITSSVENKYASTSCGEKIYLRLQGILKDISLVQRENPEEEKQCSYSIQLSNSEKDLSIAGSCSNVEPGKSYDIQVKISLDPTVSKNDSPVLKMEYPCCYDEWQSHQVTDIVFYPNN